MMHQDRKRKKEKQSTQEKRRKIIQIRKSVHILHWPKFNTVDDLTPDMS